MRIIDASSVIYAWDNYPIDQFPSLWSWIQSEIETGELVISRVAFDEVRHVSAECARWLKKAEIEKVSITNEILMVANSIKTVIGVVGDSYHPKGVGENDLLIIATAKVRRIQLISDEGLQRKVPGVLAKCKIPAVCELPAVSVGCINFIEYLRQSREIFG